MEVLVEKKGFRSVQELALNSENVTPDEYIYEDGVELYDALPFSESNLHITVVDIANLTSPSTAIAQQELQKLQSALDSCGFFMVINHGMTSLFLDKVREVSRQFFELPKEEKQKCARGLGTTDTEGYGNDNYSDLKRNDWADRVYLKVHPEDERNLKLWPQKLNDFRNTTQQYTECVLQLYEVILRAMSKLVNLEEDCFQKECGERAATYMRINYYPPCPKADHVLGLKVHSDPSTITILLQDKEVEGLQVLKDNKWFKVPIVPDTLLINVGDQMEIMSNGIFQSPVHRAVVDSEKERLTVVMTCRPNSEKEVKPIDKLVNESRPVLYKTVKDYAILYPKISPYGRPIDQCKI
ncbi:putative codeine 3-O-demethylase [Medicago truncatula]|uniref:2OG-Fe(II) oxygenase family oxidoreductase n=1 Tax=Medicago truncatula TaxID=3880 RepID=A0A072V311_MEDTR|nr:codeine O-demethylase [Medicago truncatula]KEH36374.1 2OG-Fe(II) oxygenase family oxidoreductase [Medicago truncatula]RHN71340.1 putative codeine 3-O-demethylase [Medicago truncatula]